jgi:hypothetical protein
MRKRTNQEVIIPLMLRMARRGYLNYIAIDNIINP